MHQGIRGWLAESKDRLLASDPGLGRLRQASAAAFALGTALGVEYAFARLAHAGQQGTLVSMMLGAMVAMMGSNALIGPEVWGKVKVAVFFPVAIGLGIGLGTAVGNHTDLMLVVFVAVMFVAVFIRRFGLPFFFYGFMIWMGYFFSSFLHTTMAMVPHLLVAVAIGAVWVLLLSVTVLRTNPRGVMRSTLHAFESRARRVTRECADLLDVPPGDHRRRAREERRLNARQAGLAEAALMAEGWSEDEGALPDGWSGPALRRRLLEAQQAIERVAAASAGLCDAAPALRSAARDVLHRLARRQDGAARDAAERLAALARETPRGEDGWHSRHLAAGALAFLDLTKDSTQAPEVEPVDDEFVPTTKLFLGNLPGSPAVARDVRARGFAWNPLTRLDMPTRQAVQVALAGALAIVLGRTLDPTRYYWAVIAAFVMFTGTGTRTESFLKGVNRVGGTLVGLVAAILFAHLTNGHSVWVMVTILVSVFLGFYLVRISYAYMIFFITIMIGQLYTVLHMFSDALLVLRLEETAVGAVAGVLVAVVVTPLSTRDTVRAAGSALLDALGDLLRGAAATLQPEDTRPDLDALSRGLDDCARRMQLVTRPMTRPLVWRNQSQHTLHRLGLYTSTSVYARHLVVAMRRHVACDPAAAAEVCRALADACSALSEARRDHPVTEAIEHLHRADGALFRDRTCTPDGDPVLRPLLRMHSTLAEVAQGGRLAPVPHPREAASPAPLGSR